MREGAWETKQKARAFSSAGRNKCKPKSGRLANDGEEEEEASSIMGTAAPSSSARLFMRGV